MMKPAPPMSNYERQVRFRAGHPGYFNKYNARRKSMEKAAWEAARVRKLAEIAAEQQAAAAASAPLPARAEPLMLPAPVVDPTMLALNELTAKVAAPQAVEIPATESLPA